MSARGEWFRGVRGSPPPRNNGLVLSCRYVVMTCLIRLTKQLMRIISILIFSILLALPSHLHAQSTEGSEAEAPAEVLILGVYHFAHAPDFNDVMRPPQQAEIKDVVDSLLSFRPDRVVLEEEPRDAAHLDSLYRSYLAGEHMLTANERQQLGFRLAKKMGHAQVYAIDYKQTWPYAEVMNWAREHEPSFIRYYNRWKEQINTREDSLQRHATVGELLGWLNSPAYSERLQEVTMRRLELGVGDSYVGLKPITSTYERNLRIFANLTEITAPGEHVLVIYGASHGYLLRQFVRMHPDLRLVDVRDYLS